MTNPKRILTIRRALDQSDYHVTRWPPHKVGPGPSSSMQGELEHNHAITATDAEIRMALALNPERDLQNMGDKVEDEILALIAKFYLEDEVVANLTSVVDSLELVHGAVLSRTLIWQWRPCGKPCHLFKSCRNSADSKPLRKMKRKANNDHRTRSEGLPARF